MTEIQNPKREYDLEERRLQFAKPVLVIEYCILKFICNLPARRLSGGVLGICDFSRWRLCLVCT